MAFAHLHVHTTYSICDGVARIGELFRRAKELKQSGLAITDHEVLSGVWSSDIPVRGKRISEY